MARRLRPGSLRAQLALAIALITALALGLSFLAVYRGTGRNLRDRIDKDLVTQAAEWEQLRAGRVLSSPSQVEAAARAFIAAQRYHPASRIFVVDVVGGTPVSNQPGILEREVERQEADQHDNTAGSGDGVIRATEGLSTAQVKEAGKMRVLTRPIDYRSRRVGTLQLPIRSAR